MMIDAADFLDRLDAISPEIGRMISDHLVENEGELLLHLLVADVRRVVENAYQARDRELVRRCLAVLDEALRDGDDQVTNAVAVSFVEGIAFDLPRRAIRSWPETLRNEAERMLAWRPGDDGLPPVRGR